MLALLMLLWTAQPAQAQPALPDTQQRYRIEATVDPAAATIEGTTHLRWTHPGATPLTSIPLHLYLNAFSHDQTTWMDAGPLNTVRFDDLQAMYGDALWGWIDLQAARLHTPSGPVALTWSYAQPDDGNPLDRTLAVLALPTPLAPGAAAELEITFRARLPTPIARTGATPGTLVAAQWFPKAAAYTPQGWSLQQFHGPTEFFADFADYEVTLHHPPGWLLAATGAATSSTRTTTTFTQRAVHDFAFVASTELAPTTFTVKPPAQPHAITVHLLQPPTQTHTTPRWREAIEGALHTLTRRVGPYPYATLTVVLPPWRAVRTSGMEYPTLITGLAGDPLWSTWPIDTLKIPEVVIIHELAHQYFYGILASQERDEAYLDEGLTTYWEGEIARDLYGDPAWMGHLLGRPVHGDQGRALGLRRWAHLLDEPIARRPSWLYYPASSGAQVYPRTALTLRTAALRHGQPLMDACFAAYYRRQAFRHPTLHDLLDAAAEVSPDLRDTLREGFTQPRLPNYRVVSASSTPWTPPRGHLPDDLDPLAARALQDDSPEGAYLAILDPGHGDQPGQVQRVRVPFAAPPPHPDTAPDAPRYVSAVRLRGPAWEHLPTLLRLDFEDGARLDLPWDGRAPWREVRVLRPARLTRATLDPERLIPLDVFPEDNAWDLQPDDAFTADWSLWFGAAAAWLAAEVSAWL